MFSDACGLRENRHHPLPRSEIFPARRLTGKLSIRFPAADKKPPTIIVEPDIHGSYSVTVHPFCSRLEIERAFPLAWQALEYAELASQEFGWPVIDQTGVPA